jgi:hypothetical protein
VAVAAAGPASAGLAAAREVASTGTGVGNRQYATDNTQQAVRGGPQDRHFPPNIRNVLIAAPNHRKKAVVASRKAHPSGASYAYTTVPCSHYYFCTRPASGSPWVVLPPLFPPLYYPYPVASSPCCRLRCAYAVLPCSPQ